MGTCKGWGNFAKCLLALGGLILAFMVARPVYAQVAGATLSGTVKDASGAVIPNAQVAIEDTQTGVTRTVTTDTGGLYSAPNLLPGAYRVTVTATGFSRQEQSGVTLTVGAQQTLNFTMQVGQVSETVQVTTEAPVVELTSSAISAEVNATTVRELPLNGRDWTSLATLQPGVNSMASTQPTVSTFARGIRGFGNQLSIAGGRPGQINYRLDGVSDNDYSNSSPGSVLGGASGVDAIAEFSVITSNYSAEYGRTSGGVVNAITRSGTNQFHGGAYEFLRNSALDARNFFDGPKIPPFKRNQFGADAGGPIRKDHTFIFGNFEEIKQGLGITSVTKVPSGPARTGLLTFANSSQFPAVPGDPCVAVNATQCQMTVSPAIQPYMALWSLPNAGLLGTGNTGNFDWAGNQAATERYATARLDQKFSEKDSADVTFQYDSGQVTLPDGLNDALIGHQTGQDLVSIEETHVFSSSLINSFRFGFSRSTAATGGTLSAINPGSANTTLGVFPGATAPPIAVTSLTGYPGGLGSQNYYLAAWNSFQVYDDLFFTKGKHTLKFGFASERMQDNYNAIFRVNGSIGFSSFPTFLANEPFTFNVTVGQGVVPRQLRITLFGGYAQDDFHWKPNLVFNLGLRYEMTTLPTDAKGLLGRLLTPTSTTITTGNPFLSSNPTLHNFEPRIGFAWDPFSTGKTSIRGGFGLFDVLPLPYEYSNTADNSAPYAPQFVLTTIPAGAFPKTIVADASSPTALRVTYVEPNPKRNYVEQWNLSVQHELVNNLALTVAYIGSHGVHQEFRADNMNGVLPTKTAAGYLFPTKIGSGTVLNPLFSRMDDTNWGNSSSYNALQVIVEKSMSHGFQVQGSYTFSKSLDDGSGAYLSDPFSNSIPSLFFFDKSLRSGLSDYNVAHNLTINYSWVIPTPHALPSAAAWALGGWQLGGIISARTGLPFSVILSGDPLGFIADDYDFPNRLRSPAGCGTAVNPGSPNAYINLSCFTPATVPSSSPIAAQCAPFTLPLVCTERSRVYCANLIGNSGRNSLIGPGLLDFDFSLFKNNYIKKISESFNVQFRAELFNIFNRANFLSPTDNYTLFDQTGAGVPGAGAIDGTSTTARQVQFAIKVIW